MEMEPFFSQMRLIEPGIIYGKRIVRRDRALRETGAFGNYWSIVRLTSSTGKVEIHTRGGWLAVFPRAVLYLPLFGFLEWRLGAGEFEIDLFLSQSPLFAGWPLSPILFPAFCGELAAAGDLVALLRGPGKPLQLDLQPHRLAERAKEIIDLEPHRERSFADIARELKTSSTVLGRYFKANYSMSPLTYRNHLRIANAIPDIILKEGPVEAIARKVGFHARSQFYDQFKKHMRTTPTAFSRRDAPESDEARNRANVSSPGE
jgi:AraC-like DNA-binding protein